MGSIPGLEGSPGEGNGNPLQDSCLENSMDRAAWWARSQKNWTWLSTHECWEPKWYFLRPDPKRGHKMVPTLPIHHPGLLISMVTLHTQLWYTCSQFLEDSLLYRTLSSLAHMRISTNSSQGSWQLPTPQRETLTSGITLPLKPTSWSSCLYSLNISLNWV